MLALEKEGRLKEYWTGVPCNSIKNRFFKKWIRSSPVDIDPAKVHWFPFATILSGVSFRLKFPDWLMVKVAHLADYFFDWVVSKKINMGHVSAVVGYENSCLELFKKAKQSNCITILDAASLSFGLQDQCFNYLESERFHEKIVARKKAELLLADFVLVLSEMARESYVAAGVAKEKIFKASLGVDTDLFCEKSHRRQTSGRFIFIFVGGINTLKGVDLLFKAALGCRQKGFDFEIQLAGSGVYASAVPSKIKENVKMLGSLVHLELVKAYQGADCFVLPSRFDSFGMVVLEAMACGLPVIVTDRVGAGDLIAKERNGWVIPAASADALEAQMLWCLENRARVHAMRGFCRNTAEENSWSKYEEKIARFFESILR